jgi:alkanesulfonate monooxygenase SsuD/methylene tetrahydromethanopterin reductase-like flavin-dependent oxidoreductase (luciferase family)
MLAAHERRQKRYWRSIAAAGTLQATRCPSHPPMSMFRRHAEALIGSLSVVGDPVEATQAITALFDAGSTSVVLCLAPEGLLEQIDYIGREVLPRL